MENSHDHDMSESYSSESDKKLEALYLLEESWFFESLFSRRTRMLRCYSDPCTSSNFSQEVLAKDSCNQSSESKMKFRDKSSAHCTLACAPSLPPWIGREEKVQERKIIGGKSRLNRQLSLQASKTTCYTEKTDREIKSSGQSSRCNLLRTPSLPTSITTKEFIQNNDSDIRMSNLIRQALANSPDILPPRHSYNKVMTQSCYLQRCRPPRNLDVSTINNSDQVQEMRCRYSNPEKILRKSHSDLAFQELQGFKDLGFSFDRENLSPDVVNMLLGLQGNKIEDSKQDKVMRRPYLSEACLAQSPAPPIPTCVSTNSREDLKAQIKFWARAVATNVRQEC